MNNEGFINLHRGIMKWEWYQDTNTKAVFIHCLLKANWEDGRFEGIDIPRGSFVTSRKNIAKELGLSEQAVRTAIKHLISTKEITRVTTSKFTIISINNYNRYQFINQVSNQQLTSNQPASNQQVTTIEKEKKYKNIKNIYNNNNNNVHEENLNNNLFQYVESSFGRPLGPREIERIREWDDSELTRYAVKVAVLNGVYTIAYIDKILYSYEKNNIKTVQEAQNREKEFREAKKKKIVKPSGPREDSFEGVMARFREEHKDEYSRVR